MKDLTPCLGATTSYRVVSDNGAWKVDNGL